MRQKSKHIHVNTLPSGTREGIIIARSTMHGRPHFDEVEQPHRDNGHVFILQEKGVTNIEIDFQQHRIKAPAIIYIHPDQIHRVIGFEKATMTSWIITDENLLPENLQLLADLVPTNVLTLNKEANTIISAAANFCLQFTEHTEERLYNFILKESCNTLVALVISRYLAQTKVADSYSRFEVIAKSFKSLLERSFITVKSPTKYAKLLNISTPYLNECVNASTGYSVSHHIQQRVVLEAKRLLFHSTKSIKEIAGELGYEDFSYFTRLFTKVTGMTPVVFRAKNLE